MITEPLALTTALLLGLLGGSHCIGMCGGIAATVGMGSVNQSRGLMLLGYNLGRVLSYSAAGALVGRASEPGMCIYEDSYGNRYSAECPS